MGMWGTQEFKSSCEWFGECFERSAKEGDDITREAAMKEVPTDAP